MDWGSGRVSLMMTTCFRCETPFDAYSRRNRFCSVKCRNAHKNSLRITMSDGTQKKPSTIQMFTCELCETEFQRSVGDPTVNTRVVTCSEKCSKMQHSKLAYEPLRKAGTTQIYECRYCGDAMKCIVNGRGSARWSCDDCKDRNKRNNYRRHNALGGRQKRRAYYYNAPYEEVDKFEVFKRDGWVCQLCKEPVDPDCEFPSLKYATIDHIIPLSVEGTPGHVWSNVQLAHFSCNSSKGAKIS